MSPSFFRPYLLLFLLTCVLPAGAAPETSILTLADALSRTEQRNLWLLALDAEDAVADARVDGAALKPAPTLELSAENAFGTGSRQGVRALEATVLVSRTFERGGKREHRLAVAGSEREATVLSWEVRRAERRAATASAYVSAVAAEAGRTLAVEVVTLADSLLAHARRLAEIGEGSSLEVARARAALAAAQAEQTKATAAAAAAFRRLAASWHGVDEPLPKVSAHWALPDTLPPAAALSPALATHPRVRLQAATLAARERALHAAGAEATRDLTASAGLRFLRDGSDAALVAGLSLPLGTRDRAALSVRMARAHVAQAELDRDALSADLQAEFTLAYEEALAAIAHAHALRTTALPLAAEAWQSMQRAHASGEVSFSDVLEAQRAWLALRRDLLTAESAGLQAIVHLEDFTGAVYPITVSLLASP